MINDANVKAVVVEQVLALTQVFDILQWKNVVDLPKGLIHDPHRQENVSFVHVWTLGPHCRRPFLVT